MSYINDILIGAVALGWSHWGNKNHRPKWLGTLIIYLAVAAFSLIIPEIYQPFKSEETNITSIQDEMLCKQDLNKDSVDNFAVNNNANNEITAYICFIVYQMAYSLCTISLLTHGITYIDDHLFATSAKHIALLLAARSVGNQAGLYASWIPYIFHYQNIFVSPVWLTISALTFVIGILVSLFPRMLPNLLLKKSVMSLLNIAKRNSNVDNDNMQHTDGFFNSIRRLLKNKTLVLNVLIIALMEAALTSFAALEKYFNQTKYHMPKTKDLSGYSDPMLVQLTTNLLKHPMIATCYGITGLVIVYTKPKSTSLVKWNIIVFTVVLLGFASTGFINCSTDIKTHYSDRLGYSHCTLNCLCTLDAYFQPVCLNGETYFSPCLAGCTQFNANLKLYDNCQCGNGNNTALPASCDQEKCNILWVIEQVNSVTSSGLFASTFISTLLITLRCISSRDKALATGFYFAVLGHISLILRTLYSIAANNFCGIRGEKRCLFYSDLFTRFLLSSTLALIGLAIVLSIVLVFFVDGLELYQDSPLASISDMASIFEDNSSINRYGASPGQSLDDLNQTQASVNRGEEERTLLENNVPPSGTNADRNVTETEL